MVSANLDATLQQTLNSFQNLAVDDKLALLWLVYTKMGDSITPAAPGAAGDAIAEGLYNQIKELSHEEQLEEQRKLFSRTNGLISREYGSLSENTKLLFWYRLAQGMEDGSIVPMPENYEYSGSVQQLLSEIEAMDFQQQITLLREAVTLAGSEPNAGAEI
ncbi:MAG: orange carotenoid protein N-terminal domain-containing protein [Xenococcaceae cyanobacterium]